MNLKEQLRVEIQKGLNQLEMRCHDMPSLLRGLGIQVGGSFIPLPNEASCVYILFFNNILFSISLNSLETLHLLVFIIISFSY